MPDAKNSYDDRAEDLKGFSGDTNEKWRTVIRIGKTVSRFSGQNRIAFFDAGTGGCEILAGTVGEIGSRIGNIPVLAAGKEINPDNLENAFKVLAPLIKKYPRLVVAFNNIEFRYAPSFSLPSQQLTWDEFALTDDAGGFENQRHRSVESFLNNHWQITNEGGRLKYVEPSAFTLFHPGHKLELSLKGMMPDRNGETRGYDFVIASHAYALKQSADFKARNIIVPLAGALKPGGVLMGCHYYSAGDAAAEIVKRTVREYKIYNQTDEELFDVVKQKLPGEFTLKVDRDGEGHIDPLPYKSRRFSDNEEDICAAFKVATYTTQLHPDERDRLIASGAYREPTRQVLIENGWVLPLKITFYEIWRAER